MPFCRGLFAAACACACLVLAVSDYPLVFEQTSIGPYTACVLKNTDSGEYVEIISGFGGRVEDLVLNPRYTGGKARRVLLTHNGNASAITENKGWKGMILLPFANRIAYGRYTFFNNTYQLPVNENTTDPPRVNALHGFLAGKKMELREVVNSDNNITLTLAYSFKAGSEEGYPFDLDVSIKYTLTVDSVFRVGVTLVNRMPGQPLPAYVGWHPYFACTAYKAVVTLDPRPKWNHVELNANMDPTGRTELWDKFNGSRPIGGNKTNPTFYDDEFKARSGLPDCGTLKTRLYDAETDQTVVLEQDGDKFRFVQVYTGSSTALHEDSVAIEPMSGMADAFNNHDHLTTLSGGEEWSGGFQVYVE